MWFASPEERLLSARLKELKQYCLEGGYGFYPELMRKLPSWGKEVNEYIYGKAVMDLPSIQLAGRLPFKNLEVELAELSGYLGYDDHLFEMCYNGLRPLKLKVEPHKYGRSIIPLAEYGSPQLIGLERAETVIDWHSHPTGFGDLSPGDIDHIKSMKEWLTDKTLYFGVYQTTFHKCCWYQIKEA
jgi:hypothetical protein